MASAREQAKTTAKSRSTRRTTRSQATDRGRKADTRGGRRAKDSAQRVDKGRRNKTDAERRLVAADRKLARELGRRDIDVLAKESEETFAVFQAKQPRSSAVTGEALPSPRQLARVRKENLLRSFRERRELLLDALTAKEVSDLLGVGRQTPHDRVKAGTLLAIKDNGQLRFPAWQFDPEGPDGIVEGLPEVMSAIRGPLSPLARIRWFVAPKSLMGGRTPIDALREGRTDEVVAEARSIGAA